MRKTAAGPNQTDLGCKGLEGKQGLHPNLRISLWSHVALEEPGGILSSLSPFSFLSQENSTQNGSFPTAKTPKWFIKVSKILQEKTPYNLNSNVSPGGNTYSSYF